MTPAETAQRLSQRLAENGFAVQPTAPHAAPLGLPSTVGHKRIMHWPSLASQHVFVAVGLAEQSRGAEFESYAAAALDYACKNKPGLPRGFQTGVIGIGVLVVPTIDEAVRQAVAERMTPKRWAALSAAAVVDATSGTIHAYQGRRVIGGAYSKMIKASIAAMSAGVVTPSA
ncbi:hypothetical protein [Streptodolium elevatio]|uniref:Uncharacterized protein n=1 Tax=Streptodolium elevatio TaxID=3157996 RepID=A0ABV3DAA6_9ACTN